MRLHFLEDHSNVILLGSAGLGKTHLACALGHAACLQKHSVLITTNIAYKEWPRIFASDATMTSALLDPLLHHAETVVIEGDSYRGPRPK